MAPQFWLKRISLPSHSMILPPGRALDALLARLTELRDGLDSGEPIDRVFADANDARARLMQGREI